MSANHTILSDVSNVRFEVFKKYRGIPILLFSDKLLIILPIT